MVEYIKSPRIEFNRISSSAGLGSFGIHAENNSSNSEHCDFTLQRLITSNCCQCTIHVPNRFSVGSRSLSSQTGAKSGREGEDDLKEGLSELETPEAFETIGEGNESSDT